MKETKYYTAFDRYERGTMINALNDMRNRLIDRYTDAVNELIIKICDAKAKNSKLCEECAL